MSEQRKVGYCLFQHEQAGLITKSDKCRAAARKTRVDEEHPQRQKSETDELLSADAGTTTKRGITFCAQTDDAEDRTGTPPSAVASWRNTRANGNADGSRTSRRRVDCETMAATFKSCSRSVSNCARPKRGASGATCVRSAWTSTFAAACSRSRKKFAANVEHERRSAGSAFLQSLILCSHWPRSQ
jgi:hypothetical protein